MNITKLREYHFGWGLGGGISETHSQKNKKLPNKNKQETQIHSQNIQIFASSQSRLTQAFYQTRYEQYFETLKFKGKKALKSETHPQITCYYPIKSQLIRNYPIKSQF